MSETQELRIYQRFCQKVIEIVKEFREEEGIDLDTELGLIAGTSTIVDACKSLFCLESEPYSLIVTQYDEGVL